MSFLDDALREQYAVAKVFKNTDEKSIVLLRHKKLERDIVCRKYRGNCDGYGVLRGISFPVLPRVYEVVLEGDSVTVLEEFVSGSTVADILMGGLYSEKGVRKVISDLCDALTVIHSYGIVHRDIKPENVMITDSGNVKLIDFDASRIFKVGRSADTRIIGTAGYAAPEQFGLAQSDERTDIFSLGVLMNVMLTGEHPTHKLYKGRLSRVIEKCTRLDPNKRYQTAEELKKVL